MNMFYQCFPIPISSDCLDYASSMASSASSTSGGYGGHMIMVLGGLLRLCGEALGAGADAAAAAEDDAPPASSPPPLPPTRPLKLNTATHEVSREVSAETRSSVAV